MYKPRPRYPASAIFNAGLRPVSSRLVWTSGVPQLSIGLDFGTSNTVLALADGEGGSKVVTFDHRGEALTGFISALCFWQQRIKGVNTSRVEGGPWAVDEFLEGLDAHRFIQSFKSFAASGAFRDTRIFSIKYEFEDLLAAFLKTVFRHGKVDPANARLVIGRPVRFAGGNPDPALAMQRYRNSLRAARSSRQRTMSMNRWVRLSSMRGN